MRRLVVVLAVVAALAVGAFISDSLMYGNTGGPDHSTLSNDDRDHTRAIYGYSGSIFPRGFKFSDLVKPYKGVSTALVKVTAFGETKPDKNGLPITRVELAPLSQWDGHVPSTVWETSGVYGGNDAGPSKMKLGQTYILRVRDADYTALEPLLVKGNTVYLGRDLAEGKGIDDIDGGNRAVVALDKLKAKAVR